MFCLMKSLLLIVMLSVVCLGQDVDFTVKYDKFQRVTTIRGEIPVKPSDPKDFQSLKMVAFARVPDGEPPQYLFYFSMTPKWLFNQPKLRLLADGLLMEYSSRDIDYSAVFIVPDYDVKHMANQKSVDLQISPFEGVIEKDSLTALKRLVELTKPR